MRYPYPTLSTCKSDAFGSCSLINWESIGLIGLGSKAHWEPAEVFFSYLKGEEFWQPQVLMKKWAVLITAWCVGHSECPRTCLYPHIPCFSWHCRIWAVSLRVHEESGSLLNTTSDAIYSADACCSFGWRRGRNADRKKMVGVALELRAEMLLREHGARKGQGSLTTNQPVWHGTHEHPRMLQACQTPPNAASRNGGPFHPQRPQLCP